MSKGSRKRFKKKHSRSRTFQNKTKKKAKKRGFDDILVADESKIALEPSTFYRWSVKGKTPTQQYKINLHKSKTLYGAVSIKTGKVLAMERDKHKGEDTNKFLDKIRRLCIKKFKTNKTKKPKILLIWDNASWHKSQEVKHWLKTKNQGIITLMNFPGYSPQLNPQENVWKQMKQYIADFRGTHNLEQLTKIALKFLRTRTFKYSLAGLKN